MKRFHLHVGVRDLQQSIRFYSALFAAQPAVLKDDYAKWMLDDPRLSFAISTFAKKSGVDDLGLQGLAWESFHTLESVPTAGLAPRPEAKACCG